MPAHHRCSVQQTVSLLLPSRTPSLGIPQVFEKPAKGWGASDEQEGAQCRQEGCRKLDPGEFISSTWGGISEFHSGQVFSLKGKILLHKKLWTHFKIVYIPSPPLPPSLTTPSRAPRATFSIFTLRIWGTSPKDCGSWDFFPFHLVMLYF